MYRLLIVDDESFILDSLYELFAGLSRLELEVYKANTAIEALKWIEKIKMDMVLTDIQMPGMNGLELHERIVSLWPRCKVIFLTGFSEFAYARQALRNRGFDYILKTDSDETLIRCVQQAITEIEKEHETDSWIENVRRQFRQALPLLQRDFLWDLLQRNFINTQLIASRVKELSIPLDGDIQVLMMVGRVDVWKEDFNPSDKALLLYGVQNIAEEYLESSCRLAFFTYERSLIWLLQPKKVSFDDTKEDVELWKRMFWFVHGTLESIQPTCNKLLEIPVSFALSQTPVKWCDIPDEFMELKRLFGYGLGQGQELIIVKEQHQERNKQDRQEKGLPVLLKKVEYLEMHLENGQMQSFQTVMKGMAQLISEWPSLPETLKLEVYFKLVSVFLSYVNRYELFDKLAEKLDLSKLSRLDEHESWSKALAYFENMAYILFDMRKSALKEQETDIVEEIKKYVERNLHSDLTLTRIGEDISLNPSYVSRLYKQITGESLSNYITQIRLDKSKELLAFSLLKIHEISEAIGFVSDHYFYRFFKKSTHMTPQEYRELAIQEQVIKR